MFKQTVLQLTKGNQNDMIKMSQTIDITLQPKDKAKEKK